MHIEYYESGEPHLESEYKDGWKHGLEIRKWESGATMHRGSYVMGKQQGEWQNWFSNGQLRSQITYRDGEPFGPRTLWHESGAVDTKLEERTREDGSKYLVQFGWHPNGQRSVEGQLYDEIGLSAEGIWRVWSERGNRDLEASGVFVHGSIRKVRALTEEEWATSL